MGIMEPEDIRRLRGVPRVRRGAPITGGIYAADSGYTAFKAHIDLASVFQG